MDFTVMKGVFLMPAVSQCSDGAIVSLNMTCCWPKQEKCGQGSSFQDKCVVTTFRCDSVEGDFAKMQKHAPQRLHKQQ